ncbi:zinc ribbon domain-containing protein [bacterium]|nr:zinc ribbon domain-containing protein [bacterium]
MKCVNCGTEIEDKKINICPNCGAKIKHDTFPVWAIVLIVLAGTGFFGLPIIGIVAAMTIPTLVASTEQARNKAIFKKTYSTFNQAILMDNAISGKYYTTFDDVWNKAIKGQLSRYQDIENGIVLADLTEVKYEKISGTCQRKPEKISEKTACAILTVDADGFNKGANKFSVGSRVGDRFNILLYSDGVETIPNTPEDRLIKKFE